eukprot:Colp12_sorted_trinity150504_noHs@5184
MAVLRDLLSKEKKYRAEIEDERDFLLEDNTRLRGQLERYKLDSESAGRSISSTNSFQSMGTVKSVSTFEPSEKTFANILTTKIGDACGGKNAVCTAFLAYSSINELESPHSAAFADSSADIWLCGGVDAHLSGYDSQTKAQLFSVKLSAPLLSIDVHGANIACGMMDGSHTIINIHSKNKVIAASAAIEHNDDSPDQTNTCTENASEAKVVRRHAKYVVLVKWSPDGRYLVTVSHDLRVILYRKCARSGCMEEFKIFLCASTPESACFVPASASPDPMAELAASGEPVPTESSKTNTFGSEASTIGEFFYTLGGSSKKADALTPSAKPSKVTIKEGGSCCAPPPRLERGISNITLDPALNNSSDSAAPGTGSATAGSSSRTDNCDADPGVESGDGAAGGAGGDVEAEDRGGDAEVDTWAQDTEYDLVLGMRDCAHLTYINCTTFKSREVSLNENSWDTHTSFVPLYLAPSPCGGRLLVATDKHMHIVFRTGTNVRLQVLSGHSCGDYGKPVVQWDWRGEYVFCNSDSENVVYVYSMLMGKVVCKLHGHGKGLIRGLSAHPHKSELISVSYDKTLIFWSV